AQAKAGKRGAETRNRRQGSRKAEREAQKTRPRKPTKELARDALAAAEAGETEAKPGYLARRGPAGTPILCYRRLTADGPVTQTLAYFWPRVIAERLRHRADGSHERVMVCELTHGARRDHLRRNAR
ncbi:hypothetical protein, partial [Candidatus Amarolinea dominans]|uniref:hypothetical protein n=1 Tax=Candidatus Amarolinea dominans TaxID=3140696 RepID=UPI0031CC8DA9